MNPEDKITSTVLERIYSLLINATTQERILHYSDCFEYAFGIPYSNKFLHFIRRRNVVNNIPWILLEIGNVCNELRLPPLSCLVVRRQDWRCGQGVVTSIELPPEQRSDFAEQIDCPAVYACRDYPKSGSREAKEFLNRVMERLRIDGLVRED